MLKTIAIAALLLSLFGCNKDEPAATPIPQQTKESEAALKQFYNRGVTRVRSVAEINAEMEAEKKKEHAK